MRTGRCAVLVVSLALCLAAACGSKTQPPVDPKQFEDPIADYCKSKSFGMKIASFEKVTVEGDTARVVCKMQEAEGLYGLSVTWEFSLKKESGKWKVLSHNKK